MSTGVRELWLVDPDACTVTRARPNTASAETLGEGAILRCELLDDFTLEVARIFRFSQRR